MENLLTFQDIESYKARYIKVQEEIEELDYIIGLIRKKTYKLISADKPEGDYHRQLRHKYQGDCIKACLYEKYLSEKLLKAGVIDKMYAKI